MKRWTLLFVALLVAVAACADDSSGGPSDTASVTNARAAGSTSCDFLADAEPDPLATVTGDVSCGELPVEHDITIRYVVLHATGEAEPNAVLYLEGGPGGKSIEGVATTAFAWADIREHHDIIVWDQRGVGYSDELACDDPDGNSDEGMVIAEDPYASLDVAREAAEDDPFLACAIEMSDDGVDFTQYDSQANARDAIALMDELDYDEYDLVGVSYGTRLALTMLRDFPDAAVRSVTLDSVYPYEIDSTESEVWASEHAALRAVDDCAADPECAAAYPNLRARLFALLQQLAVEPVDGDDGPIGPNELADALRTVADDGTVAVWIPLIIDSLERGDSELVTAAINGELGAEDDDTIIPPSAGDEGDDGDEVDPDEAEVNSINSFVLYGVECRDTTLHSKWEASVAAYEQLESKAIAYDGLAASARDIAACEIWPTEAASDIVTQPVTSALPAIIFVGVYDAQTPPEWADVAAADLPNSTVITFPQMAHAPTFVSWCAASILTAFIDDPEAPVDQSCIATTVRPYELPE